MFYVSEPQTCAPEKFVTELQKMTYKTLSDLKIPFERVDTDEAITMDDCTEINNKLNMKMVKTLFLCNRRQTEFYGCSDGTTTGYIKVRTEDIIKKFLPRARHNARIIKV